jgi:hypothetical protein
MMADSRLLARSLGNPSGGVTVSHVHGREALVGAWQLRSWENRADDGQVTYPMGTDALGSLLYTADNRFLS